jgi:hypothetical protein
LNLDDGLTDHPLGRTRALDGGGGDATEGGRQSGAAMTAEMEMEVMMMMMMHMNVQAVRCLTTLES